MPKLRETPKPAAPQSRLLSDSPTAAIQLEDTAEWLDILPPPPKPFGDQSRDDVLEWLNACVSAATKAGGQAKAIACVDWIQRQPVEEWRFQKWIKEDLRGWFGNMKRELNRQLEEENAARQQQAHADAERRRKQLLRDKGWA